MLNGYTSEEEDVQQVRYGLEVKILKMSEHAHSDRELPRFLSMLANARADLSAHVQRQSFFYVF